MHKYLIENFPCKNKDELKKRQGYHQQQIDCVNRLVAGRNAYEWKTTAVECSCGQIIKSCKKYEHMKTVRHTMLLKMKRDTEERERDINVMTRMYEYLHNRLTKRKEQFKSVENQIQA